MGDPTHFQLFLLMFAIQAIFGLGVGVISYLIKRSIGQMDINFQQVKETLKEKAEKNSGRIDCVEKSMEQIRVDRGFDREYFAKTYVDKDDFIRDMRALDNKIDLIGLDVKKLLTFNKKES